MKTSEIIKQRQKEKEEFEKNIQANNLTVVHIARHMAESLRDFIIHELEGTDIYTSTIGSVAGIGHSFKVGNLHIRIQYTCTKLTKYKREYIVYNLDFMPVYSVQNAGGWEKVTNTYAFVTDILLPYLIQSV